MDKNIYDYWFKKSANFEKWFSKSEKIDKEITSRFKLILRSHKSLSRKWSRSKTGFISYIILTDQFPRHIYRHTKRAYNFDRYSLAFMKRHIIRYIFDLSPEELMFALMPLQHSENMSDQLMGIGLLRFTLKYIHPQNNTLKQALKHQKGHLKVIRHYGRFPKRNEFIGRKSTLHELKYLKSREKSDHY